MEVSRWKCLRYYKAIEGKQAVLTLNKSVIVQGTVGAFNGRQTLIGLKEMTSPLGVYPRAVVKQSDIQSWEVDLSPEDAYSLLQLA